ncbi:MAG: hypothetical protein P1U39_04340 [Legionellaceae bacterium]|jgi:hypothetical protein|nr:hypothetical protein [Legionellaceae bacterium]
MLDGVIMTNATHLSIDINAVKFGTSERSPDKALKTYHPPMLVPLLSSEPEGGGVNVPEASTGVLES